MKRLLLSAGLLCVAMGALLPSEASAMSASPAWTIAAPSYPTRFQADTTYDSRESGPGYLVQAYNVGGAASEGEFKVVINLPAGTLPVASFPPTGIYGPPAEVGEKLKLACSTAARTVTCTGGGPDRVVGPGEGVTVNLPVKVEQKASGMLEAKVRIEGGGASTRSRIIATAISAEPSPFGFLQGTPFGLTSEADGSATIRAGAHPYQQTVSGFYLPTFTTPFLVGQFAAGGGLRDATVGLPPGTVVDPAATPQCTEVQLHEPSPGCPDDAQIGTVAVTISLTGNLGGEAFIHPLYNMVPPPGHAAELGFEVAEGVYVHFLGSVRSDGSFILTAASNDILAKVSIAGVRTTLWGDPTAESHDAQRGRCILPTRLQSSCPTDRTGKAFLTMPSSCGGPLTTHVSIDSWLDPSGFVNGEYESGDLEGHSVGVEGCNALAFEPTIESATTTNHGESPSGLEFDLHQTFHEGYEELATANLKDVTVALPEGLVLNPAAAGGREGCSSAQLGVRTPTGAMPIRYVEEPAHCPDSSKLGIAVVKTPLLEHELEGSVYLAKPFDNPFGSLLGIYIVVEDEQTGIIAKLAGKVVPNPATGRLATTFKESPELPLEDVRLHFFSGARAPLTTPLICGDHVTTSTLTPWSTPEGADAHPSGSFRTDTGCYGSEAAAPKAVSFTAGTVSPLSGSYSPFVLRLSREDGTQHITAIETVLPEGLLGKLAGVAYCPESGIAQAIGREGAEKGRLEQQNPSCPASSEVGTVQVGAGSGITPISVSGHAYLAGPYKGAPLSLVVIVPAVAGPFDLGTVVDRVVLNVGEYDARIHAVADPLPTIRDGIPLDVRSIELRLDRPGFTLNPTSCEAMAIGGSASTQAGQTSALDNRFQVGECGRLAFKPSLKLSLKGQTRRTGHPALKAVVTFPKQGESANIARAQVSLPHSEFLDQGNIGKACTKTLIAVRACPARSVYGKVKAWTPLLEAPLEGPVYLVGGYGYKLPALVAELDGQVRLLLVGKVDTGKNKGIRNTFEAVPDAPVSRFVLQMKGGKKYGLLENSEDLCRKKQKAGVVFTAQNGRVKKLSVKIANNCKGGSEGKRHPRRSSSKR